MVVFPTTHLLLNRHSRGQSGHQPDLILPSSSFHVLLFLRAYTRKLETSLFFFTSDAVTRGFFKKVKIIQVNKEIIVWHGGAVVSAVVSQQEGPEFNPRIRHGSFPCGVSPGAPVYTARPFNERETHNIRV